MKIAILGAGAWGTALAVAASQDAKNPHHVSLWARDAAQAASLQAERQNTRYLPGVMLPAKLQILAGEPSGEPLGELSGELFGEMPQRVIKAADLLVVATPMAALRSLLGELQGFDGPVAWLCKGFELQTGLLAHEVQAQVAPGLSGGSLSGPSFAQEVAAGRPTALVAASQHAPVRDALVAAFHSPSLRVYANDDIAGVEVGGAVKNVLAIATGLCDGLQLGLNARAALVTRGLAEMTRLGLALGAKAETFMGLSGLGDLVLTATGDLSRNRQIGVLLAQGKTLKQAVASLGHVAEGVYSARTVAQRAQSLGVEMPITQAVVALLDGQITPVQAVAALMGREARGEMAGSRPL